jgi:protein-tyrosine sulfotransferase
VFVWLMCTLYDLQRHCNWHDHRRAYFEIINAKQADDEMYNYNLKAIVRESSSSNANNGNTMKKIYTYNRNAHMTFIVGIAGSGLQLLSSLLNEDARIRCNTETHLLLKLIARRFDWTRAKVEKERLKHAGMTDDVIDASVASFALQLLLRSGDQEVKRYICNKDVLLFERAQYLKSLFPRAKFLLVVRDARATVSSLMNRKYDYNLVRVGSGYREALVDWNNITTRYYRSCLEMGNASCKVVFYEKLIVDTKKTLQDVYKFLEINFTQQFGLETHKNGVDLVWNKAIIRTDNLFSWLNKFPTDLIHSAGKMAPVMAKLGYDTSQLLLGNLTHTFT